MHTSIRQPIGADPVMRSAIDMYRRCQRQAAIDAECNRPATEVTLRIAAAAGTRDKSRRLAPKRRDEFDAARYSPAERAAYLAAYHAAPAPIARDC